MGSSGEGVLVSEFLAEYNGQKFKYNDLVDVIVGTGHGVVGKKCEPVKARFKGVVETIRGAEFLCRPLVGSAHGPCPQYPRHSVYKLSAFGACVLGSRETRYFSKLKPAMQDRCVYFPTPPIRCLTSNTPIICTYFRVMRRANEELHVTLKKARKEVRSTRSKLGEVVMKQEEKCKKAIERVKVSKHYCLLLIFHLFN